MSMAGPGCAQAHQLTVRLAANENDLRAAQRLRYRVFIEEMGGTGDLVDHGARLERDRFDAIFDHLLLIDETRDPAALDHVVGAYRLLPDTRVTPAGQFYCDDEFDLTPLRHSGRRLLELGRSCMDRSHRGGIGMLQLWQGLAQYVLDHDINILFGAASFHGADPKRWAQSLSWLHHHHLAPQELRVRARQTNSFAPLARDLLDRRVALAQMPSLIRAYLRLGGVVGEGAYVDPAFRTTDVCIILDTAAMSAQARAFTLRGTAESGQA